MSDLDKWEKTGQDEPVDYTHITFKPMFKNVWGIFKSWLSGKEYSIELYAGSFSFLRKKPLPREYYFSPEADPDKSIGTLDQPYLTAQEAIDKASSIGSSS